MLTASVSKDMFLKKKKLQDYRVEAKIMRKKIIGFLICILLIVAAIPAAGVTNWTEMQKLFTLDEVVHVLSAETSDGVV